MSRLTLCLALFVVAAVPAAGCDRSLTGPSPVPSASMPVSPDLVCVEQLVTSVTIRGDGFAALPVDTLTERTLLELPDVTLARSQTIDGTPAMSMPRVTIPDDPRAPAESRERWVSQQEMSFDVFPELGLEPGLYDVVVTNRDGNEGTAQGALLAVPRPTLTRIDPDLLCGDQMNQFRLTGDFFLVLADGSAPTIRIGSGATMRDYAPTDTADCRGLPGTSGAMACRTVVLSIPEGDLAPGQYDVTLTNPAPAACASTDPQRLTIVPRPMLDSIEPDLACVADGAVMVTLRGSGFLEIDGVTPTVAIGPRSYDAMVVDASCAPIEVMRETVRTCTEIVVTVGMGDLVAGAHDVVVTNPPPADCRSTEAVTWTVVEAPTVVSVVPENVCSDGTSDTTLVVTGTGFLSVDGVGPTVTVGAMSSPSSVDAASCVPLTGVSETVEQCTRLSFVIPAGMHPPGDETVTVTNPAPAGCSSSASIVVHFVGRPTITSAVPTRICAGGGTMTLTGTGFAPGASVTLGTLPATTVTVNSATQIVASFSTGLPVGGPYDLVVSNAPGCDGTLAGVVTVVTGPQIFFADPPVVYGGINTQVLLYVTGVSDSVSSVTIAPPLAAGGVLALTIASALSLVRLDDAPRERRDGLRALLRRHPLIRLPVAWVTAERFAVGCMVVSFSLYAHRALGLDDARVGSLYGWFLVPFVALTYPTARVEGTRPRAVMVALGLCGYACALGMLGLAPARALDGVMLLAGVSSAAVYGPSLRYATSLSPTATRSSTMALLHAGGSVGMLVGTASAGAIASLLLRAGWGPESAYPFVFAVAGLAQLAALVMTAPGLRELVRAGDAASPVQSPA